MPHRAQMMIEFRRAYEEMIEKRTRTTRDTDERDVRHAERNFYAPAEALARQVPTIVEKLTADNDQRRQAG